MAADGKWPKQIKVFGFAQSVQEGNIEALGRLAFLQG
jgi:hypothetical protein